MRSQVSIVRKNKPWAGLTSIFPNAKPATRNDIQLLRRFWHVGMMGGLALLYEHFLSQKGAILLITLIGGPLVIGDLLRLHKKGLNRFVTFLFGPLMRKRELLSISGMTYFILGLLLVVAFFPKPVAVISILCLAVGDSIACIVGVKFGKDPLLPGKSLQGTLACFASCTILIFVALEAYGLYSQYALLISLLGGITAALAELFSSKLCDDNFSIPVLTASVIYPLLFLLS